MRRIAKETVKKILNRYLSYICSKEFESQSFLRFNERPVEFKFVFEKISEIYPQKVLDVGTGTTALPHLMRNCGFLVTATDNVSDYWPSGMINRHYHVIDDDITATRISDKFDMITCISVLEHIQDPNAAIKNMFFLLKRDGYLILTFPYNEKKYVKNVYELPGSSYGQGAMYITQSFSRNEINQWLEKSKGKIIDQVYWEFWTGDYWTLGEQVIPPKKVTATEKHQLTCILIQKC